MKKEEKIICLNNGENSPYDPYLFDPRGSRVKNFNFDLINIPSLGEGTWPRNDPDRILWALTEHGGSMSKSDLARCLQMRIGELDVVLRELERVEKVRITEIKGKLVVVFRDGR
jgi:hypothetical protein